MKQTILSFLVLAGTALGSFAQTSLQAGDIAFLGIQSTPGTNGDRFAFILLKPISDNTTISFTDKAVINPAPVRFCSNEGLASWTSDDNFPAGTIVTIEENGTATIGSTDAGLGFSQDGDQILAFQKNGNDTILVAGISTAGWLTDCATVCGGTGNNQTCLPPNLVNGVNAIGFSTEKNNAFLNLGNFSGTQAEILAAINNPANWTQDDVIQTWPSWDVSVVTSVKGLKANKIIRLTPGISDGNFTIENTSGTSVELSIHNLLGQSQFSDMLPVGKKEYSLPVLPKGIYFAKTKDLAGRQSVIRFQISK
jgi:hypothetical protein